MTMADLIRCRIFSIYCLQGFAVTLRGRYCEFKLRQGNIYLALLTDQLANP